MKKILALALAALLLVSLVACGEKDDDNTDAPKESEAVAEQNIYNNFTYAVNDEGNYEIIKYTYTGADLLDIEIPSEINGRPVTGIGEEAFKACATIKSVKIPESVTYISNYAFYDCDALTAISIPKSVKTIGMGAFQNCSELTSVTLTDSVVTIGDFAFLNCEKLETIELFENLTAIGASAFEGCKALTEITIPTTVTKLGECAFYKCSALADVTALGTKLTEIGKIAFNQCADTLTIVVTEESAMAVYAEANEYNYEFPVVEE